jgi:hypothetical protein
LPPRPSASREAGDILPQRRIGRMRGRAVRRHAQVVALVRRATSLDGAAAPSQSCWIGA